MIDVSARDGSQKVSVYLDGADARLFKALVQRLGSEKAAQNAIILEGLVEKLKSTEEIVKVSEAFPKLVGMSYFEFSKLVEEIS
ncbi:MAG: hypothetical protein ACYCQJ_07980 [Nitrososphaerales archaeon]